MKISLKPLKSLLGWGEVKIIAKKVGVSERTVFRTLNDEAKPNRKVLEYLMKNIAPRKEHMMVRGPGDTPPPPKNIGTRESL